MRLSNFQFALMLLADIRGQDQPRRVAGIFQIDSSDFDIDQRTIPPAMLLASSKLRSRARFGNVPSKRCGRCGGEKLARGQISPLLLGKAIELQGSVIQV